MTSVLRFCCTAWKSETRMLERKLPEQRIKQPMAAGVYVKQGCMWSSRHLFDTLQQMDNILANPVVPSMCARSGVRCMLTTCSETGKQQSLQMTAMLQGGYINPCIWGGVVIWKWKVELMMEFSKNVAACPVCSSVVKACQKATEWDECHHWIQNLCGTGISRQQYLANRHH